MALSFPNQKHSVYISVNCESNMMIRFYIYIDHLFQLLRKLNSLAFHLIENIFLIPNIKYLKAKCLRALNLLKVLSHTSWGADRTTLLKLYRSLVRSKLDYGCIIYDMFHIRSENVCQKNRTAVSFFLNDLALNCVTFRVHVIIR